jgi:hypothetical protein
MPVSRVGGKDPLAKHPLKKEPGFDIVNNPNRLSYCSEYERVPSSSAETSPHLTCRIATP